MEQTIQQLSDFVTKAGKLGKYARNSSLSILNAIKTAERGLEEDEPKTIKYLQDHLEELFVRQNDLGLSPQSIPIYVARVKRAVADFETYGTNPKAIYSWSRVAKVYKKNPETKKNKSDSDNNISVELPPQQKMEEVRVKEMGGTTINTLQWKIRTGVMIRVELPDDLNQTDVNKIKALLDIELGNFPNQN